MNPLRFLGKCLTNPPAAWASAKLVARSVYSQVYWKMHPGAPLRCRLAGGGVLLLEPGHSFTQGFWPAVDNYEPDVREALRHFLKPGATFVDCGSNIGYFSVLAGHRVGPDGRVIAIEANPVTHRLMEQNLKINGFGIAVHCALTAKPGEVELFVPRQLGDAYSSLRQGGLVQGQDIDVIKVPGRTLDEVVSSLGLDRIDLLKIDIEGAELDVLRSARRVLRELRPVVICEYGMNTWPVFGATAESLLALLQECHYSVGIFDAKKGIVQPVNEEVWKSDYANLILQPMPA
jgi:FkbM family methyltransferase